MKSVEITINFEKQPLPKILGVGAFENPNPIKFTLLIDNHEYIVEPNGKFLKIRIKRKHDRIN